MRRPQGYALTTEPGKADEELDTFSCTHCNAIVFVAPGADPSTFGGFCRLCMKHICGPCADAGECTPFERRLEEMERSARFMRAVSGG